MEQFLDGPALAPPKGVNSTFDYPGRGNVLCVGVFNVGLILVVSVVSIRLYTRIFFVKRFWIEDVFMIAALAAYVGFISVGWTKFRCPGGFVHLWDMRVRELPRLLKAVNLNNILYCLAMLFLKISIFIDWIHIFAPPRIDHGGFYYACVGNMVVNTLFYAACILVEIFACTPRKKIWDIFECGTCVDVYSLNVASSVFDFVLDVVMLGMPQYKIWKLQLSKKQRVAISLLFTVGALGCICGGLRIVYSIIYMNTPDKSYYVTGFGFLAIGEMTIGFLVLCVPLMPRLIKEVPRPDIARKFLSRIGLSSTGSAPR